MGLLTRGLFLVAGLKGVWGAVFTLVNQCSHPVWPGTLSGNSAAPLGEGGFLLPQGASASLTAPAGWSGRFWARTGCSFDDTGSGHCTTGDCCSLKCAVGVGGAPPVSLAEFTLQGNGGKDFYDVSLVDGYNLGLGIKPKGGTGDCQYAGCLADLNQSCPAELQVLEGGAVVACKSACAAFNTPQYCCTGPNYSPSTCSPTMYSQMFKTACPTAYSYAYDDASSTCTCTGTDYVITFCPSGPSKHTAVQAPQSGGTIPSENECACGGEHCEDNNESENEDSDSSDDVEDDVTLKEVLRVSLQYNM
ncbi:pathogenesis-related thaumatin-like protein 3.5 [Aristolochia californica]|uniref:pathogenesis-related thaumatin-like protein 3.5 n=1 Tax=Aristolochia californica TaxID=171875 RepID=UPI0035DF80AD